MGNFLAGYPAPEPEDGEVVLEDTAHKHIASRALQEGQNPLDVARQLLCENTKPTTDFYGRCIIRRRAWRERIRPHSYQGAAFL